MPLPDWIDRVSRFKTALLPDQVADAVRRQIRGREMTDRIPSELHLAQMYGVSRITVRRALEKLADERLVVTVRGRGTLVASQND